MIRSIRFAVSPVALAFAFASLAGCGQADSPPAEPGAADDLAGASAGATIGARGGTIEGNPGTALAGVKLVIPAGALSSDTAITIHTTFDPTPLPPLAESVGVAIAIEPSSLALAKPASLTLPASADLARHFQQSSKDCKVWYRDGDHWSKAEPTATSDGSVTIDLPALTTAAAGVKIVPGKTCAGLSCSTCTDPNHTGFCSARILFLAPAIDSKDFAVDKGKIYYLTQSPAAGGGVQTGAVRVNIVDGTVEQSTVVTLASGVQTSPTLTVDVDGSVWAGFGVDGNLQFEFGSASNRFDYGFFTDPARGAALLPVSNELARFRSFDEHVPNGAGDNFTSSFKNGISFFAVDTQTTSGRPLFISDFFSVGVCAARTTNCLVTPQPQIYGTAFAIAPSTVPNGEIRIAMPGVRVSDGSSVLLLSVSGTSFPVKVLPFGVQAVAFDATGKVWIGTTSPEVAIFDPKTGALNETVLTTAAPGTDDYGLDIPIALHDSAEGMIVMTQGRRFFLVKPN